jgi:hypothetical protein
MCSAFQFRTGIKSKLQYQQRADQLVDEIFGTLFGYPMPQRSTTPPLTFLASAAIDLKEHSPKPDRRQRQHGIVSLVLAASCVVYIINSVGNSSITRGAHQEH